MHAFAVGDAAAVAVVGPDGPWILQDFASRTYPRLYGSMTMTMRRLRFGGRPHLPTGDDGLPAPTYRMDGVGGQEVYHELLGRVLPELVNVVLARNGIGSDDISLITHQGSRELMERWQEAIRPAAYLHSLDVLGNMALATYPVNLARSLADITTPYVAIAAVGTGAHLAVALLRHRSPTAQPWSRRA